MSSLVSVCITTYNRKEFLPITLKSVLKQTYKNLEIIIVDDFSDDGTDILMHDELLKLDHRIKYIRHDENKGLAHARNTAIDNANGKYFSFCDDDDLWMPNFLEEFVNVASNYDTDWCFCCSGKIKNFLGTDIEAVYEYEGDLKNLIKKGFTPPVASQFYNLSILKEINGYNRNINSGVDHDLWIRLAQVGVNIKYIPKVLSLPNVNKNQLRMTTNYQERLNGLQNSMLEWKSDLIKMYGDQFFLKFSNAYYQREQIKFLSKYTEDLDIAMILKIKKNIPLASFVKSILLTLIKKILKLLIPKMFVVKKKILVAQPNLKIKI